jgi:hypothetical protein
MSNKAFKTWTLYTSTGVAVIDVDIPIYAPPHITPELVVWGTRFFIYNITEDRYMEAKGQWAIVPGKEQIMAIEPIQDESDQVEKDLINKNGFNYGKKLPDGQYERHPTEDPTGKKFVRPIRRDYYHDECGKVTKMPVNVAETIAVNPTYYNRMFCAGCRKYIYTGEKSALFWLDDNNEPTDQKVGT